MRDAKQWNPRYVAYARHHGNSPSDQLSHDAQAWPGGKMTGFKLWIKERWADWKTLNGIPQGVVIVNHSEHEAFTNWLMENEVTS